MRKLAPMFVMTSIVALAGGAALANTGDTPSSDKMGSPTVSANTRNPQGLSYGDKNNMSTGTNAKIDSSTSVATDDSAGATAKKKHKKAKIASNTTVKSTNEISSKPAAANSLTGQSAGGDGGSAGASGSAGSSK